MGLRVGGGEMDVGKMDGIWDEDVRCEGGDCCCDCFGCCCCCFGCCRC